MKQGIFLVAFTLSTLLSFSVNAQEASSASDRKHALGIRISSKDAVVNNSITYKYYFNSTTTIEGLFSFSDPVALGVMLEKYRPFGPAGLSWFWGAGAYVGFGGGRNFGAQGVIGLDLLPASLPINISIDWKPELNFISQFSFEPAAVGVSARFAF